MPQLLEIPLSLHTLLCVA